ncbi:hypothetical protein [uncultured Prevotella sp.]|uniref:hypothetical protein n=1 Tax=uncultured Prevotella sp. TaxID=159272 RepID=UPI00260C647A|nr:hypothetical protein [uncultured Prevotella sp.]
MGGISYGQGQETVVKTLSFPPDNKQESEVNDYTSTRTYTIGSDSWSVTAFNNANWSLTENGHKIIRCGRKNNTSVASIATSNAYSEPITKVVVTLEVYGEDYLNDAVLTVSSDNKFSSDIQTVRLTPAKLKKGDVAFEIPNPIKDSFYKLTFNCTKCKSNGQTAHVSKVQYLAVETKTATNVTFGAGVDGKTFDVTEGEESSFSGKTATEKNNVAGTITYSSNNTAVVSVDKTTGVVTFVKAPGTAIITASFAPDDAVKYKESSASYTINYKEKVRIATTLAFAEPSGSVNIGEAFTLPELTLKTGEETLTGRTFTYSSSAPKVASIDETGAVTIHSAGNTVLTAKFVDPEDKYETSSADFTLKVIDPNAIVFSAADKSFDGLGTGYAATEKEQIYQFVSASEKKYDFKVKHCIKSNNDNSFKGYLQMRPKKSNQECGIVTSPSFTAFPNGYKVTVYYSTGTVENPGNLTISSKQLPAVKSETVLIANTADGKDFVTTISLPLSDATFTMTANENAKYVSKIELTPLAAPEMETVTLDETANNDDVVKNNAGKTVNVTLKRTISDKYLNPFCVPFDMTADQITAVFGEGCVVSAFTSVTGKVMNFEKVATITAGQPYVVQATKASTEISLDNVEMKSEPGSNVVKESSELSMSFNGIVSPYTFKKNDGTELFLDKNGNLRYPSTLPSQMKGMRAYFEVLDGTGNEAKVNIGGGLSSIDKLMNGEAMTGKVYNLNGQYVGNTLDGLAKGLYIMNGKKYVVK